MKIRLYDEDSCKKGLNNNNNNNNNHRVSCQPLFSTCSSRIRHGSKQNKPTRIKIRDTLKFCSRASRMTTAFKNTETGRKFLYRS